MADGLVRRYVRPSALSLEWSINRNMKVAFMESAAPDWYEDDELWRIFFPFMFPESSFESARSQVRSIIELSGVEHRTVLDLCCGPGRFAVPLALAGFAVTGVDRTAFLLDRGREYAAREAAEVEWVRSDMRQFARPDAFDLAINLFTSFGYFDDPADNLTVLENVYRSLRKDGVFVFEAGGKEVLARIFEATGSQEIEGVGLLVQRRKAIDDWSRMENEWLLIRDGRVRSFRLRHWIYSGRELRQMLESVGFSAIDLYGGLDGSPYGPDAQRLVAVARKA